MKQHIRNTLLISLLVFLAWNNILYQPFMGEGGYAYFFKPSFFPSFNLGTLLLFNGLVPYFRDNFFLYQSFAILNFAFITILFYFFVYQLTQRKDISFIAGVLFGANFSTSFEMLAMGAYGNFIERVFFLLLFFPSLILFFMFRNNKKWYYYVGSIILCSSSVFLAHFNMFFVVLLPVYILAIVISDFKNVKKNFSELLHPLPLIFVSYFIVSLPVLLGKSSFIPKEGLVSYVFNNFGFVAFNSMRQLVFLTYPEGLLLSLTDHTKLLYKEGMQFLFVPTILLYVLITVFLYIKEKSLRIPVITSVLFLPIAFVLNIYLRGDNVDHLSSGSRYLFAPSIGFAIFWALVLGYIGKRVRKRLVYIILACWFFLQVFPINREIDKEKYHNTETKIIIEYLKHITPRLAEDSIVIVPTIMGEDGAKFCNLFYGKSETLFLPFYSNIEWLDKYGRPFDPTKDIILSYDENRQLLVDRTKDYNEIIIYKDINSQK